MRLNRFLSSRLGVAMILLATCVLVYGRSLGNDFVVWDDDSLVYKNPLTQELSIRTIVGAFTSYDPELYVPVTILSFQAEHALFGFTPFFFHLDNLLLHAVAAFLVFLLLERWGLRRTTAATLAAIFVVHPINVETVVWVSARKDLLAAIFSIAAVLTYRNAERLTRNILPLLFFVLAMLCKPVAIVLPAACILIEWKDGHRFSKAMLVSKIPLFALSAVFLVVGLYGKHRNLTAVTPWETLLLAFKSTAFSLEKFFAPVHLSPIYLQSGSISLAASDFAIPVTLLLLLALVAATLVIKDIRGSRTLAFALAWYMIFLLPSFSNFAKDGVYFFSDRYVYLSQIGLLLPVGIAAERFLAARPWRSRLTLGGQLSMPVIVLFGILSFTQTSTWKDSVTLYRDALANNPRSVVMHYNLAVLEHKQGNREAALLEYQKALTFDPSYAKAHANLGVFYNEEKNKPKALEQLRLAIEADPSLGEPHNTLGSMHMDEGNVNAAIAEFRLAIAANDEFAQAHINLAAALGRKGLYEEAVAEYKRALELAPQILESRPDIVKMLRSVP